MSSPPPSHADLAVVPSHRLAELVYARLRRGDADELKMTAAYLEGRLARGESVPENSIRQLADAVELRIGQVLPDRSLLHVDLKARRLRVDDEEIRLRWRRTLESVCRTYLQLMYRLRSIEPGTRVPIRTRDLHVLSTATAVPLAVLRTQVWHEMSTLARHPTQGDRLRSGVMIPAATVAVGVSAYAVWDGLERQGALATNNATTLTTSALGAGGTSAASSGAGSVEGTADGSQLIIPTSSLVLPDNPATSGPVAAGSVGAGPVDAAPVDAGNSAPLATGSNGGQAIPERPPAAPAIPAAPAAPSSPEITGAAALSLIQYDWVQELPGWQIVFMDEQPGRLGYAHFAERRIEIYVRGSQSPYEVATVVAHELGHAVDVTHFDGADRTRWLEARGLDDEAWWPAPSASSDFGSGAGDWAESFAHWLLDDESQSELGGEPTAAQMELISELTYR